MFQSSYGVIGAEQSLPLLTKVLERFKVQKNNRYEDLRLSSLVISKKWFFYSRDFNELKLRLNREQDFYDLLSWLIMFFIEHVDHLIFISTLYQEKNDCFGFVGVRTSEIVSDRVGLKEWQLWAVKWMENELAMK